MKASDNLPADSEAVNSLLIYLYRDASNYKFWSSIILRGTMTLKDVEPHLLHRQYFIPQRVGLVRLVPAAMNHDDHELHEIDSIESVHGGDVSFSATEFLYRVIAANKAGWFKENG